MPNPHKNLKEHAFEAHIEKELAKLHKFRKRSADTDYDKATTFDRELLFEFLRATQSEKLERLEEIYGDDMEERVARRIDEQITARGVINVLRKGVEEGPVRLELMFFRPVSGRNPEIEELFENNIFSVIRQVKFSQRTEQSVDMVIFVNGVPIFTAELKNEFTGQTVEHAKRQYMTDRDPREKLFSFKRCVAHFAVDTNEVFVTTELKEDRTFFLPFNKGYQGGVGNPPVENKHKTYYLWEDVWAPEALSDLLQAFVHAYEEIKEDRLGKEYRQQVQLFPRYHQWRAVLDLLSASRESGSGRNYLVQHSAGSGKSLTIAWLAYRLAELFAVDNKRVYDAVIVLTDRRILDKQLRNTIRALEATPGILIAAGEDNTRLKDALESNAKIITTTIQKFPFVQDVMVRLADKKFALIVDEAHSSQSGELRRTVQETLGDYDEEEWLLRQLASRQQPENISYFAFTATPRHETLERFGERQPDGSYKPFSLYSMKQAIEEGFILDVLTNYTTYRTYFKLIKKLEEDPTVPRGRALSAILRYVSLHPETLEQKVEVIMAHFEQTVRDMLRGEAKAMIVTRSREAAVRYKLALDVYLRQKNYPYKTLVAFTDSIEIDGETHTETSLNNGVPEEHTASEFKKPGYRFLIVAEKYQTGFDEPFLCAMYVDKHLSGVQAVQTLSRLNRTARDKDQVYVLDFVNEVDEIKQAFEPYYTTTIISEGTDINAINDLRSALFAIYQIEDRVLDDFVSLIDPEAEEIHEQANAFLDDLAKKIIDELPRGESIGGDKYSEFLSISNMYLKRYPYLAQVLGYSNVAHEKLYLLLRYLLKKLPKDPNKPLVRVLKYVDMDSVRVVRKIQTSIDLLAEAGDVRDEEIVPGPVIEEKEDPLSQIVQDVNKRWGVDFDEEQQKTLNAMGEELATNNSLQDVIVNNVRQNAEIEFEKVFDNKVDDQFEIDRKLWQQIRNNKELQRYLEKKMFKYVSDKVFALREE
ncbi:MAG: type I restriction endonuclease [Patescibacteria group bacterium]|jgi:type I restriction enzyme R subunit